MTKADMELVLKDAGLCAADASVAVTALLDRMRGDLLDGKPVVLKNICTLRAYPAKRGERMSFGKVTQRKAFTKVKAVTARSMAMEQTATEIDLKIQESFRKLQFSKK
jgi:nucleoid DNA-binding protein